MVSLRPHHLFLSILFIILVLSMSACQTVSFESETVVPEFLRRTHYIADSSYHHFDEMALATARDDHDGDPPIAWGRYIFNQAGANWEINGYKELTIAETLGIREASAGLVPIVAPDQHVLAGSRNAGESLARNTGVALMAIIGLGSTMSQAHVLVFLDVENDKHPISDDFLIGWCEGLNEYSAAQHVEFLPGIYTNAGLSARGVRESLRRTSKNCAIRGLWLAHYVSSPTTPQLWQDMRIDKSKKLPAIPDAIPIYLWQYHSRSQAPALDYSVVNPLLGDAFSALVLHFAPQVRPTSALSSHAIANWSEPK